MEHVVYRAYDADGLLLYIGMSSNYPGRLAYHRATDQWWKPLVARIDLEHVPSRAAAFEREAKLIHEFRPPYNRDLGRWTPRDELIIKLRQAGKTRDEIAREVGMKPAHLSKRIKMLLAAGRIERQPSSLRRVAPR